VYAAPTADFVTSSTQLTFPNTDVTVTNTSTAGESADHYWTFGDGQVSYEANPGTHDYGTWGTYDITLEVDNGYCSSVANTAVQILAPTPTIGFTGEGAGCAPLTVQFNNLSMYASSYRWEFSDGSVRSDDSPVHVFNEPGVYDVTLYVEGYEGTELMESHTAVVEVFPTAEAAFTLNPNHVMVPGQPVFFLNLSEDATEYMWDFGDGATSISETPVHEYLQAGVYDVTLTANNVWGCSTTYNLPEAVLAEEGGMMVFPNAFTPSSTGSNGGYYDPTGYDNDVFRPMHMGVETYELMVFTKWGEMVFYSNDVNIGWDGYIQGRLAATDVYAWKATATLSNGEKLQRIGNMTLLAR
jgi:PKD repeat protein